MVNCAMLFNRRNLLILGVASALASCSNRASKPAAPKGQKREVNGWLDGVSLPEAVQEIYPCAHNGRIHLAGGFTAENGRINGPTNGHHSWAAGETSWRAEPAIPAARHHPHMISFKDRLLAIAGFESPGAGSGWTIQKTGWALSSDGTAWETLAPLPAPAAEAVTGITGDGILHLAGGRTWAAENKSGSWQDHLDTDHHFVLTDPGGRWERAAPCPFQRNSAAGDVLDGRLHIVGGRQVGGGNLVNHSIYDHKEDRWRERAPMPQAQGGLAAAALGGKLFVFGGEFFDNGGGVYPEGWVYDPARDSWQALPDMPRPRHGLGAVKYDGAIYVIGGALKAGGVDTSPLVEVFRP